jgi:Flp pilus assembly protein TadD
MKSSRSQSRTHCPSKAHASISLKQHLAADALPAATTAVKLAPESADAHYVLGRAQLELGDTAEAIPQLEKAVSLAPNSPEPHFALARAYAKTNMSEKAQQERAAFTRLNALAEQQRAAHGNQSYQGPREAQILNSGTSSNPPTPQP